MALPASQSPSAPASWASELLPRPDEAPGGNIQNLISRAEGACKEPGFGAAAGTRRGFSPESSSFPPIVGAHDGGCPRGRKVPLGWDARTVGSALVLHCVPTARKKVLNNGKRINEEFRA